MSLDLSDENFISRFITRFELMEKETPRQAQVDGKERNFRFSLAQHFFETLLGWTRVEGQGHYVIGEKYDIALYDEEKFHVIIVETKNPDVDLTDVDEKQIRDYIEEVGSARYGILTNWHRLILYEYNLEIGWKIIVNIDIKRVIYNYYFEFSSKEKSQILELRRLERRRLVKIEDHEYFIQNYRQIPVLKEKEKGIQVLTTNLGQIIINLTDVMQRFFETYRKRGIHHSKEFLDKAFSDWLKVSGKEKNWGEESQKKGLIEVFCKETAYVLMGRLLFIRICEDKEISRPLISGEAITKIIQALLFLGKTGTEYLSIFESVYERIDDYYEHFYTLGIFDWWNLTPIDKNLLSEEDRRRQSDLEKELNNVVRDMLRVLNRFDFAKVDKDILKDVYQHYLPTDERKRLGEFYTPDEVITYILDAVGYTSSNEIESKFLLDPACGSGSFLVEALRRLIGRYETKGLNLKDPTVAKTVLDEVASRIYGLDINPFACFIAEMNILFQVVDLYEVVKRKYSDYKLKRFHIYQTDSLAPPLTEEQKQTMELELIKTANSRAKYYIEENVMADFVKEMKFDFIVGNPPYVRKERISPDYKENVLHPTYSEVYHGDNDICIYFIARGIQWLNENGQFGYIVSGKFTKSRYGEKLREYIPNLCCIKQFLDFRGVKVFQDVTNDPIIFTLEKESSDEVRKNCNIKCINLKEELSNSKELIETITANISKTRYIDDVINLYESKQGLLTKESWKLVPIDIIEVFNKIQRNSDFRLEDKCGVYFGVKTGKNDVYIVNKDKMKDLKIKNEFLKPVLKGEDIKRYKIDFKERYLVFPYVKKQHDEKIEYIAVDIEKYPNLFQYLNNFKSELANRYDIRESNSNWYELRPCNYYSIFESGKIISPDISKRNNFAYDDGKYYCLNTCYIISLNKKDETETKEKNKYLKFLTAILNSKVLEFYFKQIGAYLGKKGYRFFKGYLDKLPIKNLTKDNRILSQVDQMLQLKKEYNLLEKRVKEIPDFQGRSEKLWIIAKSAPTKFSKGIYKFSNKNLKIETVKDLTGESSYRLRITKKEYFTFRTFNEAQYVQKLLQKKGKVSKSELISLNIPSKDDLDEIMNQHHYDKNRIKEIKEAVTKMEDKIDELVYELYGLNSEDQRIIEDYLVKF